MPQGQAQGSRGVCVTGGAKGCQRRMPKGQEGCPRRRTDPVSRGRGAKRRPQQCHPGSPRWSAETSPRSTPPAIPIARPTFGTGLSSSRGTFHDPGSSLWMEEYQEAPPLLMSGCAAQRPEGEEGGPWPWEAAPTPQRLPSPKELCQKKRKGPKQKGLRHLRGLSVLYHLEEVKRRQSNIDKQKAAQEGGALPQLSPQRNGMVRDLPACLLSPARTPEPYARPFLGRGTGAQLCELQPPEFPS
ncbi:protein INCA1 isoform X4 [Ahaetulla prasina]|uniref:protein INCA1 isoform X4 n=1 Tax=Ahaetulla prasina TaxID=499056 RepID=UPI002649E441|nr:protein INCA1 isoform X4 [Ahaetulla prasina]